MAHTRCAAHPSTSRHGHGTGVDWWNLGMVTYEILTGLSPWYTTDRDKLFERLRNAPLKFPYYVSRTAASVIQGLLDRDPTKRLGAGGKIMPPCNPCRNQDEITDCSGIEVEFSVSTAML